MVLFFFLVVFVYFGEFFSVFLLVMRYIEVFKGKTILSSEVVVSAPFRRRRGRPFEEDHGKNTNLLFFVR